MEAMHIHYFYDMGTRRTVAQYKFNERPESLYIPDIPIGVIYLILIFHLQNFLGIH